MGYIYVIHSQNHILLNLPIYKIGMTENIKRRFNQYPKGSKLLYHSECYYYKECEKYLISEFIKKYIQKKDYGNEYFEGDIDNIISDVKISVSQHLKDNYEPKFDAKPKMYVCDRCHIKFSDLRDFKRHINSVNDCGSKCISKCTICDKIFDKSSNLTRHIITIHKNKEITNNFLKIKKEDKIINSFGQENISCLSNIDINKILTLDNPINELLQIIYFNKVYKYNLNFHFATISKHKYVVYKKCDKEWIMIKTDIFIDNLIDNILSKIKNIGVNDILTDVIKQRYTDKNCKCYKLYKEKFTLSLITYQERIIELKYEEMNYQKDTVKNEEQLKMANEEYIKKQIGRPKKIQNEIKTS